jgi:cytidylate kinase
VALVTISQGTRRGARAVAERVATALELPLLSREILVDASKTAGIDTELLESVMERRFSVFDRFLSDRETYLLFLRASLLDRATRGGFVYLGHAAHLLLHEVPGVVRILVVAPMEQRVKAIMQDLHLDESQARRYIGEVDRQRSKWTRFLYDLDWLSPLAYDFVVNLERLTEDQATELICGVARSREAEWTPDDQKHICDLALASRVLTEISRNVMVRPSLVKVSANDGAVDIQAKDYTQDTLDELRGIVENMEGVRGVRVRIESS